MKFGLSVIIFFLALASNVEMITALGLGWSTFILSSFLQRVGKDIPLTYLILLVAALQWIVGPWLAYTFYNDHFRYHMYVPEVEYMLLAVPGTIFLSLGLLFREKQRNKYSEGLISHAQYLIRVQPRLPYLLIILGILCSFLGSYVPSFLRFVFFLLANVKYIGLIYLLFSTHRSKWLFVIIAWALTLVSSIQAGLFHDLLLWTVMVGVYAAYIIKPTFRQKVVGLLAGFLLIFMIQVVKKEYRQLVWYGDYTGNRVNLYTELVSSRLQSSNQLFSYEDLSGMVVRINQGWINSKVMEQVPEKTPFAGGSTINEAIMATLVPRVLAPNKKVAGGQENFEKFTGIPLRAGTSMGISLLGEGYANYGVSGAWIFMILIGLFYSIIFSFLTRYSRRYPTILLWLPLIFLQVIKAETELVVVLNHLVKSLILVLGFFWAVPKFLNWKL